MLNIKKISILAILGLMLNVLCTCAVTPGACTFMAPEGWNQNNTRWDGECRDGYAEGLGVLKEFANQKVNRFFFGRIKKGEIQLGVIDQAEGYMAGSFSKGRLVPSEERQNYISAFAEAEKAAMQVASSYRKAGNTASAQFYETKAKELREQMD